MKVLVVANRLPVTVKITGEDIHITQSSGGLVSALAGVHDLDAVWIGWPGCSVRESLQPKIVEACQALNTVPVFLSADLVRDYYNGYCNSVIWPILHYVEDSTPKDEYALFASYVEANQKFADVIFDEYMKLDEEDRNSALLWIHDYHLMLVPSMLRNIMMQSRDKAGLTVSAKSRTARSQMKSSPLPNQPVPSPHLLDLSVVDDIDCENLTRIGFFLHTPFPEPSIWKRICHRHELLRGLLAADFIAFHIYAYKQFFLDACSEIEGVRTRDSFIDSLAIGGNVRTWVKALPIGIDLNKFQSAAHQPAQQDSANLFKKRYGKRKLILGVDRSDYMKGIYQKLKGYQRFHERFPELAKQTVLLQLAVPSRGDVPAYRKLMRSCHELSTLR